MKMMLKMFLALSVLTLSLAIFASDDDFRPMVNSSSDYEMSAASGAPIQLDTSDGEDIDVSDY